MKRSMAAATPGRVTRSARSALVQRRVRVVGSRGVSVIMGMSFRCGCSERPSRTGGAGVRLPRSCDAVGLAVARRDELEDAGRVVVADQRAERVGEARM